MAVVVTTWYHHRCPHHVHHIFHHHIFHPDHHRTTLGREWFTCWGLAVLLLGASSWEPGGEGDDGDHHNDGDHHDDGDDDDDDYNAVDGYDGAADQVQQARGAFGDARSLDSSGWTWWIHPHLWLPGF